jgi:hypothetical protein
MKLQQSTPSASQPIRQTPLVIGDSNTQGSSRAGASMVPNPQPRTSEEQTPETPSAKMQAIEQVYAELKSHMK